MPQAKPGHFLGAPSTSSSEARDVAHPYAGNRPLRRVVVQAPSDASLVQVDTSADPHPGHPTNDDDHESGANKKNKKKPSKKDDTSGQPKSTRQQNTACRACRFRRVKCDLREIMSLYPGVPRGCTNCVERGYKCEEKEVRQLRKGKRIAALEETILREAGARSNSPYGGREPVSIIPRLEPEFFASPFFRRFHIQRPILDPEEFSTRYIAWMQDNEQHSNAILSSSRQPLTEAGQLLAKVLVVWAASYGVNEKGEEDPSNSDLDVDRRTTLVKAMVEELIGIIDMMGLLHRPSWDGVRVLLMTLPLAENAMSDLDRLAMYEAAVQQVYTLCQHDGILINGSPEVRAATALVRARIFWYAHVHEGITTGLRGGRLLMDQDDLDVFQRQLPNEIKAHHQLRVERTNLSHSHAFRFATAPLRLANACRLVHSAVTGPKARASSKIDGRKLEFAWEALQTSWEEFESLRSISRAGIVGAEEKIRFVDGWQIFLFDCHNVIHQKIDERLQMLDTGTSSIVEADSGESANELKASLRRELVKYRDIAISHCENMLNAIVKIIQSHNGESFFAYDASLVRDGVFYAGYMLAKANDREEDMEACLKALAEMRWAFCKRATRIQTVRGVYAGVRQAKEVRARKEEERRRQNTRRANIPSQQPPLQPCNTGTGFSPQQAYAPNQAKPQPSGQVNIHRYLMSSTESYPQLAPPVHTDTVLPPIVDQQDTSPGSQLSVAPSKDESNTNTRVTQPATHSPSSASEHSEPAELPPQPYYSATPPFASTQSALQKTQPVPYPPTLTSQHTPHPYQQRNTSTQSLGHSEMNYSPINLPPRYSPQQPYSLQQQLYPAGVVPGHMFPSSVGLTMAPPSTQSMDTQNAFAGPSSTQSSIQPSPGGGLHADMYGGIPDPAPSARLLTKFDMDVAEWMSTQRHPQYQAQLSMPTHYTPQPIVPSQHSQAQRGHGMYPPNSHQNSQLHGTQVHPHYSHTQKDYFYPGQ